MNLPMANWLADRYLREVLDGITKNGLYIQSKQAHIKRRPVCYSFVSFIAIQ